MKIDQATLHKIAHLARLDLDPNNESEMRADVNGMIAFVEKLNEVNTDGVLPLTTMSHEVNVFRENVVITRLAPTEVLLNAPDKDDKYFRVPKVLE